MDSYHFHFERMSNLDLHPLSLPVSRLSPAKSSSSIDQYTHHHSKGDSAYSSFSGGSTVPDYPSPFLLDELQSQSLHLTDLKYVRGKSSPGFLDSDPKSMDHLYRSVETVAQHQHWSSSGLSNSEDLSAHTKPPTPPARLNSFVTTRNLENSRARQSPEGQHADSISTSQQSSNPEICSVQAESDFGRTFLQFKNQGAGDKVLDPPKLTGVLNRSVEQTCQPEHLQQSWSVHAETQRQRSHSVYGGPVSEHQPLFNSCHMPQKMISGSIQHKGQFFFITGVFKSSEPSVVRGVDDNASLETSAEWSYKSQRRRQSCPDGPSGKLFFQEEHKFSIHNEVVESPNNVPPCKSEQSPEGTEDQRVITRETGRHHSTSHPIFYCGPEDSSIGEMVTPSLIKEDQTIRCRTEKQMTKNSKWTQLDIPNDKISKETTPLLYHLTGANRASHVDKFKNNNDCGTEPRSSKCDNDKPKTGNDGETSPSSEYRQSETAKEEHPTEFFYQCTTLDDSYKKYYKEKLKDAQTKVLRATSFKRRDLQLSHPNRIKQRTDTKLSVLITGVSSQDVQPNLDIPTLPLHKPEETQKEKDLDHEIQKVIEKEIQKPQNIAQPQVPRIGSRKRLTADQKKLSHSEPEKLHQLADGPAHVTCRSLDYETEGLLSEGDHGLVAARRKMFETRGRAMSASNFSKSSLKHLQHKALVAYMERKTGQKVAEPQRPVPQVPSHRNSKAERFSEGSSRHETGFKKLHRPLSAGQILDSVSGSVKYAQFISAQPSQSSCTEGSPTAGKSASVESLLDQPEQPKFFWTGCASTPPPSQVRKHPDEFSAIHSKAMSRKLEEDTVVHHSHTASVPDERRVVRARGKSMEELGVSVVTRFKVLSKSSEQLDQLQGKRVMPGTERRVASHVDEGRHTQRKILSAGEHTEDSQAGPETPLLTTSVELVSSNEDKITEDGMLEVLEVSKEQKDCPQDESETSVSSQEVSLGHGVTTDPSLWITASEVSEAEGDHRASPEMATYAEPQNTPPAPSEDNDPTPVTTLEEVEPSQVPTLHHEQDNNLLKEDGALVIEGNGPIDKLEWEVLVQEVVSADQSLARTLYPITNRKTALMLMEQLLSEDTLLMEEHYKKKQEQMINDPENVVHGTEMPVCDKPPNPSPSVNAESVLKDRKDVQGNTETDLINKKRRLMAHIEEKLKSLEDVRSSVQGDEKANAEQGEAVEALIRGRCLPTELERYTQFIGDLERVVSLLLCLSARLARVQNALSTADDSMDAEERQSLDNRYRLLCKQREDAKDLKDNLDRRERVVATFLSKQLTDTQLQEYRRFIQTKASLLIRQKDLEEKQRLGEEQLEALLSTLPETHRPPAARVPHGSSPP